MRFLNAFLLAGSCLGITVAHATEVYRWTDADGVTHFGQRSVAVTDAERVRLPQASFRAAQTEQLDALQDTLARNRAARAEKRAAQEQQAAEESARSARCAEARQYRERLQNANRLFRVNADGIRERVDESARHADLDQVEQAIEKACI